MLRKILTDKFAVNILKLLYENEKKGHICSKYDDITNAFGKKNYSDSIAILDNSKLIVREKETLTITNKGKRFITTFDQLIEAAHQDTEPKQKIKIIYDLPEEERKILLNLQLLSKKSGDAFVSLATIAKYISGEDSSQQRESLSKAFKKMEELGIVILQEKENLVGLTSKGKNALKEIVLENIF